MVPGGASPPGTILVRAGTRLATGKVLANGSHGGSGRKLQTLNYRGVAA
jgi:hypothetical protein